MHEGRGDEDRPFGLLDLHTAVDTGPVEAKGLLRVNKVGGWDQEAMRGSE